MSKQIKTLEQEFKKLQKAREEKIKRKNLERNIWVLKHPKLVMAGEKTRYGLGKLSSGIKKSWVEMKEKEKQQKKIPQESYSERLNKALKNL